VFLIGVDIMEKKIKNIKNKRLHIQDIPDIYIPKNSKAKDYRKELVRMMSSLRYTNEKIQYSSQVCAFNVRSISHKSGFIPNKQEVFRQMSEYVYHYENYCFRAYSFREKLLQFINAIFRLNFDERDVKIRFIKINPIVIDAKLVSIVDKFDKKKPLGKIIKDRNSLTHKLYYGYEFDHYLRPISDVYKSEIEFKKWCLSWKREITTRSKYTDDFTNTISDISHELALKIVKYKEKNK
jgi:hypothetical protein